MITLTMKSARQPDFQMARDSLIDEIAKEYRRHSFVLKSPNLPKGEKKRFEAVLNRRRKKSNMPNLWNFCPTACGRSPGKKPLFF